MFLALACFSKVFPIPAVRVGPKASDPHQQQSTMTLLFWDQFSVLDFHHCDKLSDMHNLNGRKICVGLWFQSHHGGRTRGGAEFLTS